MPLAFLTGIVVSLLSRERRAVELFYETERQMHLGAPARALVRGERCFRLEASS